MNDIDYRVVEIEEKDDNKFNLSAIIVNDERFVGIIFDYFDVEFSMEDDNDTVAVRFDASYKIKEGVEVSVEDDLLKETSTALLTQLLKTLFDATQEFVEIGR